MTHQANHYSNPESVPDKAVQIEADLFNAIVDRDAVQPDIKHPIETSSFTVQERADAKITYPWDPDKASGTDFFNFPDGVSPLQAFDDAELDQQANGFFNQLDQLWDSSLVSLLNRKFATVPQNILASIAQQAEGLMAQGDNLVEQLAQCVQSAMPQWAVEDLQVLARPVAYAMRGESQESQLFQRDWETLSGTERAKLTLAIARYAIHELEQQKST